jgi:hypothetical protein
MARVIFGPFSSGGAARIFYGLAILFFLWPAPTSGAAAAPYYIAPSTIHGRGAFSSVRIAAGARIGPAARVVLSCNVPRRGEAMNLTLSVTPELGLWVNHCARAPTARVDRTIDWGVVWLRAVRPLRPGDEITVNYNAADMAGFLAPAPDHFFSC